MASTLGVATSTTTEANPTILVTPPRPAKNCSNDNSSQDNSAPEESDPFLDDANHNHLSVDKMKDNVSQAGGNSLGINSFRYRN